MSDRQARNARKARKRRAKLLAAAQAITIDGANVRARLSDYNYVLVVAVEWTASGMRHAVASRLDRLYRRMDHLPEASRLLLETYRP